MVSVSVNSSLSFQVKPVKIDQKVKTEVKLLLLMYTLTISRYLVPLLLPAQPRINML